MPGDIAIPLLVLAVRGISAITQATIWCYDAVTVRATPLSIPNVKKPQIVGIVEPCRVGLSQKGQRSEGGSIRILGPEGSPRGA